MKRVFNVLARWIFLFLFVDLLICAIGFAAGSLDQVADVGEILGDGHSDCHPKLP